MPTKKVLAPKATKTAVTSRTAATKTKPALRTHAPLVYATDAEAFWTNDGVILNSLVALGEALSDMPKAVFSHHVTGSKNDFATWVAEVLGDAECAKDLRKAKTAASAKKVVVQHLTKYHI